MDDNRSLAEQIEAMKDDPEAWGNPEPPPAKPRSEKRQRGVVASVRLTGDELAEVQEYADSEGLTVSSALRTATLRAARAAKPAPVTTGSYGSPRSHQAFLSSALADQRETSYETTAVRGFTLVGS